MMHRLTGLVCAVLAGFGCAGLPEDGLFFCEPGRVCTQRTADGTPYVCYPDDYCRPPGTPSADTDAGATDAGATDAGATDAGATDAGATDACVPISCSVEICGSLDNGCGTTIDCGGCGTGFFCGNNRCQQCAATDLPDDAFDDRNCDGIDGQLDGGIFVSEDIGNDSWPGTKSQPVASLAVAFDRARAAPHKTIYVGSGTYDAGSSGMLWDSPVSLYGGYSADFSSRDAVTSPVLLVGADGIRVTATDGGFTIERISVSAGNAVGDGKPSVAMTVLNAQGLALRHALLRAGNGSAGTGGQAGGDGAAGLNGADGGIANNASAGAGAGSTGSPCGSAGGAGGGGGTHYTGTPGVGESGTAGANNVGSGGLGGSRFTGCDNQGTCGSCPQGTAGAWRKRRRRCQRSRQFARDGGERNRFRRQRRLDGRERRHRSDRRQRTGRRRRRRRRRIPDLHTAPVSARLRIPAAGGAQAVAEVAAALVAPAVAAGARLLRCSWQTLAFRPPH